MGCLKAHEVVLDAACEKAPENARVNARSEALEAARIKELSLLKALEDARQRAFEETQRAAL